MSQRSQINGVFLQGVKAFLGTFALYVLVASNLLDSTSENCLGEPNFLDDRCNGGILYECKEEVILSEVRIVHGFLLFLCLV